MTRAKEWVRAHKLNAFLLALLPLIVVQWPIIHVNPVWLLGAWLIAFGVLWRK